MAAHSLERTGALVVRAWVEPGRDDVEVRARISYRVDLTAQEDEAVRLVAGRDGILGTVTEWLDALTG